MIGVICTNWTLSINRGPHLVWTWLFHAIFWGMPQCRYAPFSDRPFFLSIGSTGRSCASHSQQILDFCLRFGKTMVAIPDRPIWLDRNIQKNVLVIVIIVHNWLVVYLPLRKIWVRQLGWWHSQYDGKNKSHVPNHQPDKVGKSSIWLVD